MAAVADAGKGDTNMAYKIQHQPFTKQNMRHQVCAGETCRTTIFSIHCDHTHVRGRSNCEVTDYVSN